MAKYILIRLIDGSEYYVEQNKCVAASLDPNTGKKSYKTPGADWIIHGVWYQKLFGKGYIDLISFVTDVNLGKVRYEDKKGWKYGIHETRDGKERIMEPLSDYGIAFLKMVDKI